MTEYNFSLKHTETIFTFLIYCHRFRHADVDVDVEWMYELRQSPLCPPQTYDLHSNDTNKFLAYYSTAL